MPTDSLSASHNANAPEVVMRAAELSDASAIWQLTRDSHVLDLNSRYAYLLLCDHFGDSCFVAEIDGKLAGFVTAYRPPNRPGVIFVWQVAVAPWAQKRGLARRLLEHLLAAPVCDQVDYLEATIGPSNAASQRLFTALAEGMGVAINSQEYYPAPLFGDGQHEAEHLFRIGPLPGRHDNTS